MLNNSLLSWAKARGVDAVAGLFKTIMSPTSQNINDPQLVNYFNKRLWYYLSQGKAIGIAFQSAYNDYYNKYKTSDGFNSFVIDGNGQGAFITPYGVTLAPAKAGYTN